MEDISYLVSVCILTFLMRWTTVLYGNHEVLNAAGLFHYTEGDEEYEEILGHALDRALDPNDWRQRYAFHQPARWAA